MLYQVIKLVNDGADEDVEGGYPLDQWGQRKDTVPENVWGGLDLEIFFETLLQVVVIVENLRLQSLDLLGNEVVLLWENLSEDGMKEVEIILGV